MANDDSREEAGQALGAAVASRRRVIALVGGLMASAAGASTFGIMRARAQDAPVCPQNYGWDEAKQECVVNPVCPEGYSWDGIKKQCIGSETGDAGAPGAASGESDAGDDDEDYEDYGGGGGGGGCFLTTACCEEVGLLDDCFELRSLRRFRDSYLLASPGGAAQVARYYQIAPYVLRNIPAARKRAELLRLYAIYILPSAVCARVGLNALAYRLYLNGMASVTRRFLDPAIA